MTTHWYALSTPGVEGAPAAADAMVRAVLDAARPRARVAECTAVGGAAPRNTAAGGAAAASTAAGGAAPGGPELGTTAADPVAAGTDSTTPAPTPLDTAVTATPTATSPDPAWTALVAASRPSGPAAVLARARRVLGDRSHARVRTDDDAAWAMLLDCAVRLGSVDVMDGQVMVARVADRGRVGVVELTEPDGRRLGDHLRALLAEAGLTEEAVDVRQLGDRAPWWRMR